MKIWSLVAFTSLIISYTVQVLFASLPFLLPTHFLASITTLDSLFCFHCYWYYAFYLMFATYNDYVLVGNWYMYMMHLKYFYLHVPFPFPKGLVLVAFHQLLVFSVFGTLDYSNARTDTIFKPVCLIYFTLHCVFKLHPFSYKCLECMLLYSWVVFYYVEVVFIL